MIDAIELDPNTMTTARLASGRFIVRAEDLDWSVMAVWSRLPSGRPLVEHVSLRRRGVAWKAEPGDLVTGMWLESARRAVVRLLAPWL